MRRLHPEVDTTDRFEELMNDAEIDAVVIATPVRFHYEMAKACLNAGKHVFIEKPMARTVAEAEELVALADQQGLVIMVGHTFLFSPAVRRMKQIIDAVTSVKCSTSRPGGLIWVCSKRISMWRGTWRRTTFRSCFICWTRCPLMSLAKAAAM